MIRNPARILVALLVLAVGTGCAAPTPAPTSVDPTPTVEPTPEADPPATLVISGMGFDVRAGDGTTLDSVDFDDDPTAAIALISSSAGVDPAYYPPDPGDACPNNGHYVWEEDSGSLVLVVAPTEAAAATLNLFDVRNSAGTIGGLAITTVDGFAIGDDVSAFVSSLPAEQVDAQVGAFIWDRITDVDGPRGPTPYGGYGSFVGGELTWMASPGTLGSWYC